MAADDTRVLIVGLPQLQRELIESAFAERQGYEVLHGGNSLERLLDAVEAERPDYVVVPLQRGELPPECEQLIKERARLKFLAVELVRGSSRLVRLRPTTSELSDIPPHEFVERIAEVLAEPAD